jgi:hypothetical protein
MIGTSALAEPVAHGKYASVQCSARIHGNFASIFWQAPVAQELCFDDRPRQGKTSSVACAGHRSALYETESSKRG